MNLQKKLIKIKHCLASKKNETETLRQLSQAGSSAKAFANAFLKSKSASATDGESQIFANLERYRERLRNSSEPIDFSLFQDSPKTVGDICKRASSKQRWCEFYYRLVKELNAANAIEIGTNLGVSGQYFLSALKENNDDCFLLTFEGIPDLCRIANQRFLEIVAPQNFKIAQGFYDDKIGIIETLPVKCYDLIFIDGNHSFEPTIKYFNYIKQFSAPSSVFIFDDINWSDGMRKAWAHLKTLPCLSIDLLNVGVLIFDENKTTKNFKLHLTF